MFWASRSPAPFRRLPTIAADAAMRTTGKSLFFLYRQQVARSFRLFPPVFA
jgi:hypothetical protein